jgi:methionyl-tRNA synthetase
LLREMTFGQDASFSDEGFLQRYNADLANGLGNASSRVLAMARRYLGGRTPAEPGEGGAVRTAAEVAVTRYGDAMDAYEFQRALEAVWELLAAVDGYVNEQAPWGIAKSEGTASMRLQHVLYNCLEALRLTAVMVEPIMPSTSARLLGQLGVVPTAVTEEGTLAWGGLPMNKGLGEEGVLFPRADVEGFFAEVNVDESKPAAPAKAAPFESKSAPHSAGVGPAGIGEELISIEEFARTKLVVGTVKHAERVPKSKKLVRMEVDVGEPGVRQIVAGIGGQYEAETLIGRQIVVVANLKPATLMGVESRGMLLAASVDGVPFLLSVDREVPPGSGIK